VTLPIIRYSRKHSVSEIGCFRPQVKKWRSTLWGPLGRAHLINCTSFRIPDDGQSPNLGNCKGIRV
jgi:hypothetical protein